MNYSQSIQSDTNNLKLKNIPTAEWFQTMDHCPQTVGQMKLLISIADKLDMFKKIDFDKTENMTSTRLNIIYAILRITGKLFDQHTDHIVKTVFCDRFKEIFYKIPLFMNYAELFSDQLTQDIDYFVCDTVKHNFPFNDKINVKNRFITYLETTFSKPFYKKIMNKISYDINESFFNKHNYLFTEIINEFINYTHDNLLRVYQIMNFFLEKTFDETTSTQEITDIAKSLSKCTDLNRLFNESCLEIDVYSEQKLDSEDSSTSYHTSAEQMENRQIIEC